MKHLSILTLLLALFVCSCQKGTTLASIDACPIDTMVNDQYMNDAKEMLYQNILKGVKVQDSDQPVFNQTEVNRVLSAIQSVYAMHTPRTDSIFNTDKIHAHKIYLLNSVIIKVDVNSPEIKNLVSGKPTGNADFDALLAKYHFTYDGRYPPDANLPFMGLYSDTWYNMKGMVPLFLKYPFIQGAQANGTVGDGNNITYRTSRTSRILDFSIGFGDCPAGCGGRITWEFSVDENCHATQVR